MGPKLDALRALQDVELQIVDIKQQLARRQRAVARQTKELQNLEAELENESNNLKRSQVAVDEADLDLKARQSHIDRMRERLNTVRTNKEYAAVLAEMNNEKADVSKLEAHALEMMDQMETAKGEYAEREKALQRARDKLTDLQNQLAQTEQSFADRLSRLQRQRDQAAEDIPAEALTLFDRLSERYDGEALAEIERTHPRRDEFICSGCYMQVTTESANAVQSRDDVVTCPNCGRIMWMEKGR
jgi:hypothetical protein